MATVSVNPSRNFRPFSAAKELLSKYEQQSPAALAVAEQAIGAVLVIDGVFGSANPFTAGRKNGVWGNFISLLVGLVLLIVFPLFFGSIDTQTYSATTTGTIVGITPHTSVTYKNNQRQQSTTCSLQARYTVDGTQYTQSSFSSSSGVCNEGIGSSVQVQYNPKNPVSWDTPDAIKTFGLVKVIFTIVPWIVIITSAWGVALKSAAIIFGIIIWRRGRALAHNDPNEHVDAQQIKSEVQDFFQRRLWGFNG